MLGQRCPRCREGAIYSGLMKTRETCPVCGLGYYREGGYFLGAMYFSYGVGVPLAFVIWFLLRWMGPDWPFWLTLTATTIVYLPFVPLLFRYARVVWMYMDQLFDPR